jgi:hypothetical protein
MSDPTDYIGNRTLEPDDKLDYGVKGMKWGVRNDDSSGIGRVLADASRSTMGAIKGINRSPKYKGKDLTKDPQLKAEYDAEVAAQFKASLKKAIRVAAIGTAGLALTPVLGPVAPMIATIGGGIFTTTTTTRSTVTSEGNPDFYIEEVDVVEHAGKQGYRLEGERDEKGFITEFRIVKSEIKHYGIKGMKWGVRRTPAQLESAAKSEGGESSSSSKSDAPSGSETSEQRYSRLAAQARSGKASSMSDADLKFFNARTEAMAKVNKLNEQKPGWLAQATKTVVQKTAQRSMQTISDALADKYINDRITSALKDNSAAIKAESKTPVDYVGRHRAKKST